MENRLHIALPAFATPPSAWQRLRAAFALGRERKALSELDPHLLRDVGLSQDAADKEASRPIWDAPDHWHS